MNINIIRHIIIDTETTGLNKVGIPYEGHKIIEIGAVEIVDRHITGKCFHSYINPNRLIDSEAFDIHGINNEFLKNKKNFKDIADSFLEFVQNSILVVHNASFDIGFINYELSSMNHKVKKIESLCTIIDTLQLAREIFPGKLNNLNALCNRCFVRNKKRTLHGALIDAKILAKIFLFLTGGQMKMTFENKIEKIFCTKDIQTESIKNKYTLIASSLKIIYANEQEISEHEKYLNYIKKISGICIWDQIHS